MSSVNQIKNTTDVSEAVHQVKGAGDQLGAGSIAILFGMISKHKLAMYSAIIFATLSAIIQFAPPAFAGLIIASLQDGNKDIALYFAIGMLVSAIIAVLLFTAATMTSHLIAASVQAQIRLKIAKKLKFVSLGYFSRISGADIKKILVDDVEQVEDGIAHLIPEMTAAIVGPLFILVLMMFIDWRLGIASLLPTFIGLFLMTMMMRNSTELTNRFYRAQADIASKMGEVIEAIPVVKTYNHGDSALRLARNSFANFTNIVAEWIRDSHAQSNWFFLFASSNLIFVTPLSLLFLYQESIGLPVFVFFNLAALTLTLVVSSLFGVMQRIRLQEGLLARYAALMNEEELTPVATADQQVPDGYGVNFNQVSFGYDEEMLFENLSFNVPSGTSLALVGPSGSGKSTIAKLMARFWDVKGGKITLGGADIRKIEPAELARNLSFVFQDVFLFTRSVKDNILIGRPGASDAEVFAAAKAARVDDFVAELPEGYDTIIDGANSLSVGQKQRLSIARALLRDAPVLVLDEATAFADPENEHEVQKAISNLAKGKTLIIIAHRLSTIQNLDQIMFIDKGKIIEQGTHKELLAKKGAYADQWNSHMAAQTYQVSNKTLTTKKPIKSTPKNIIKTKKEKK